MSIAKILMTALDELERPDTDKRFVAQEISRALEMLPRGLTFADLREANIARIPQFKDKHGRHVHNADGSDWSLSQWFQALAGEVGEYANIAKKFERGDLDEDEFRLLGGKELADVQTYLDILAFRINIDLGAATVAKFNEVTERVGASIYLTSEGPASWTSKEFAPIPLKALEPSDGGNRQMDAADEAQARPYLCACQQRCKTCHSETHDTEQCRTRRS